jgi:hypothetical protein
MSVAIRDVVLELFQQHRATPGAPFDESHFTDFLLAYPKRKGEFAIASGAFGCTTHSSMTYSFTSTFAFRCMPSRPTTHSGNSSSDRSTSGIETLFSGVLQKSETLRIRMGRCDHHQRGGAGFGCSPSPPVRNSCGYSPRHADCRKRSGPWILLSMAPVQTAALKQAAGGVS